MGSRRAHPQRQAWLKADKTRLAMLQSGEAPDHGQGTIQAFGHRFCEGGPTLGLDSQSIPCAKKEREMANVCRLRKPKQGMP
jgi:hypothetical protein